MRTATAAAVALCAACVLGVGCKKAPPESDGNDTAGPGGPPGATAPSATAPPLDHLAPGELVEGTEDAFGLTLPRGVHVEFTDRGDVRAVGLVTLHAFVKYLRSHVQESDLDEGD